MTTGQRIKKARKRAEMTQKELAQKLGIPFQGISQWENDLRNPKPETIEKIANALGVDYMELVPQALQGPYFAAYMLRHPEITVEDECENIIIQGTGRTIDLSMGQPVTETDSDDAIIYDDRNQVDFSQEKQNEDDFEKNLKKLSDTARVTLRTRLSSILEELPYEDLEALVKYAQFIHAQAQNVPQPSAEASRDKASTPEEPAEGHPKGE